MKFVNFCLTFELFYENNKVLELDKKYPNAVLILSNIQTFANHLPLVYEDFSTDNKWVARVQLINSVLQDRRDDSFENLLAYINNDTRIQALCTQLRREWNIT